MESVLIHNKITGKLVNYEASEAPKTVYGSKDEKALAIIILCLHT